MAPRVSITLLSAWSVSVVGICVAKNSELFSVLIRGQYNSFVLQAILSHLLKEAISKDTVVGTKGCFLQSEIRTALISPPRIASTPAAALSNKDKASMVVWDKVDSNVGTVGNKGLKSVGFFRLVCPSKSFWLLDLGASYKASGRYSRIESLSNNLQLML